MQSLQMQRPMKILYRQCQIHLKLFSGWSEALVYRYLEFEFTPDFMLCYILQY